MYKWYTLRKHVITSVCVCMLVYLCVCMCYSYVCVYIDMYVCHCCMCVETFAKTSKEKCLCNEQLRTREPSIGSNTFNSLDSQTITTIEAYVWSKAVRRKKVTLPTRCPHNPNPSLNTSHIRKVLPFVI